MMKILYVSTISNMINVFLIPHIKFLVEQGNEVGIACQLEQDINPELKQLGCKVHSLSFQRDPFKRGNLDAYKRLKEIVIKEGYQLLHVHSPVASFISRFACRNIAGVRILYTAHGFHFFKGAPKKNWVVYYTLEKIAARWTDGIITMNEEDFESAKKLNIRRKDQIYKVHGVGLDLTKFKPLDLEEKKRLRKEYSFNSDDFLVIYVGELCHRKHQDLLIKAVGKAKTTIPNIKLLIVGDGDLRENFMNLSKSLGCEDNTLFLGYRKDVQKLMSLSDVVVSTSRQEGLPVNVMEGMASGLATIVTDCRGNSDLVRDGENGIVIKIDDIMACSLAIENLYYSKEIRERFGKKNREIIQDYSLKNVIGEMKEIYSKVMLDQNAKVIQSPKQKAYHQQKHHW